MFSLRPYLGLIVPYKINWQASSTMSLSGTEVVDTLGKRLEDIVGLVDIHSVIQRTSDTQLKHAAPFKSPPSIGGFPLLKPNIPRQLQKHYLPDSTKKGK